MSSFGQSWQKTLRSAAESQSWRRAQQEVRTAMFLTRKKISDEFKMAVGTRIGTVTCVSTVCEWNMCIWSIINLQQQAFIACFQCQVLIKAFTTHFSFQILCNLLSFFLLYYSYTFCLRVFWLHVYLCTMSMPDDH